MAGMTVGTERASGMQSILSVKFREAVENKLVCGQPGLSKAITFPMNAGGKIVRVFNNRKIARVSTEWSEVVADTEAAGYPAPVDINLDYLEFTMQRYAAYTKISKEASYYIVGDEQAHAREILGINARESIDFIAMRNWAMRSMKYRVDNDSTYQRYGTVTSLSTSSTTQWVDANGGTTINLWVGGYATWGDTTTIDKGAINFGQTFQITAYGSTSKVYTISAGTNAWMPAAMPKAAAKNDKFWSVVGTGLTAGDVLTAAAVRRAVGVLERNAAPRFQSGGMAGYFAGLISSKDKSDLEGEGTSASGTYQTIYQYTDKTPLMRSVLGPAFGVMWFMTNQPLLESVAGAQSDTGAVSNVVIFGEGALLRSRIKGEGNYGITYYTRTPEQLAQPIPSYGTSGWEGFCAYREHNAWHSVSILTVPSAQL